jgi:hypothetical protein
VGIPRERFSGRSMQSLPIINLTELKLTIWLPIVNNEVVLGLDLIPVEATECRWFPLCCCRLLGCVCFLLHRAEGQRAAWGGVWDGASISGLHPAGSPRGWKQVLGWVSAANG